MKALLLALLFSFPFTSTLAAVTPAGLPEGYHELSVSLAADRYSETRDIAARLTPVLEDWLSRKGAAYPTEAGQVNQML